MDTIAHPTIANHAIANDTEAVVRRHLQTFIEQKGVDAIASDYADDAVLYGEAGVYRGKPQIRGFFQEFIASLPPHAIPQFALRSLRVDGELAYITWSAGRERPLGTDTFLVRNGKIVRQTYAMHVVPAA